MSYPVTKHTVVNCELTLVIVTVKEQCLVLFPYTAQNEDELTLQEGQVRRLKDDPEKMFTFIIVGQVASVYFFGATLYYTRLIKMLKYVQSNAKT